MSGQGPNPRVLPVEAHSGNATKTRAAKKKKKKSKRDSTPYSHVSHSPVGCHRSKQGGTPPHSEALQTPLHPPAENPPVTPQCVSALSAQSRQTLCSPMNCSQPGSSVPWRSQARILSRLPSPSQGSSQSGFEPKTPELQVDSLPLIHLGRPGNHPLAVFIMTRG